MTKVIIDHTIKNHFVGEEDNDILCDYLVITKELKNTKCSLRTKKSMKRVFSNSEHFILP